MGLQDSQMQWLLLWPMVSTAHMATHVPALLVLEQRAHGQTPSTKYPPTARIPSVSCIATL